jgi:GxxExxY protein
MPIVVRSTMPIRRPDEREFVRISYAVSGQVFAIHNEFGRFFEESIYKRELARRMSGIELEVPVEVSFGDYRKTYFLDVLASGCAIFEFKAVETLTDRHRSQLFNYLMLCDLPHGKLFNVRAEEVEHEFANAVVRFDVRRQFVVEVVDWSEFGPTPIREWFTGFVREVGTGLDVSLYEDALTFHLGGEEVVERRVEVKSQEAGRSPRSTNKSNGLSRTPCAC